MTTGGATGGAGNGGPGAALGGEAARRTRVLTTPEGVPLAFTVAPVGDRVVAFGLDLGLILGVSLLLFLVAALSADIEGIALFLVGFFLLRTFYFTWLEQRWRGATLGKRSRGLRVIDAAGGQLGVEAIVVRNLTREFEFFVPLSVLIGGQTLWPHAPAWGRVAASVWFLVFALLPLFNRERRRVGDLAAGTMVVRAPRVQLLSDLAESVARETAARSAEWEFTEPQLSRYGEYELMVLEEILRNPAAYAEGDTVRAIRAKIQAKIEWPGEVTDDWAFLRAFYAAQRAHLERGRLFGRRRADKRAAPGAPRD